MTQHQELLAALPPALTFEQVGRLLRVPMHEVIAALAGHELLLDDGKQVLTAPLLAEFGLLSGRAR